jgi:cytosine/adenosine deaminase-related metal-dependent hydrolase
MGLLALLLLGAVGAVGLLVLTLPKPRQAAPFEGWLLDVTVVNPLGPRCARCDLRIAGGLIKEVRRGSGVPRTHVVEGSRGRFVLPGLIDMHVHLPPRWLRSERQYFGALWLAHGVTSVREAGSLDGRVPRTRGGALLEPIGPRVFSCGPVLDGDRSRWPTARVVRAAEDASAAVRELAAAGVDCVKVYSGVGPEALQAITRAARSRGLRVIGHLSRDVSWDTGALHEIQHVCEPRCEELGEQEIRGLLEGSRRSGVAHTPTLVVYERQRWMSSYRRRLGELPARLLPRWWREVLWDPDNRLVWESPAPEERAIREAERDELRGRIQEAVARLHGIGAQILAGTDVGNPFVVPGESLLEELRLFIQLGMGLEEALATATIRAAEALGRDDLGRIRAGARADLLILESDPTQDLRALESLVAVMMDGSVYRDRDLEGLLEIHQRRFQGPVYDTLSTGLARLLAPLLERALARETGS